MLRGIDTALELVGWSLAVFFVILLFAGPRVVAEDKPEAAPAKAQDNAPAETQDNAPAETQDAAPAVDAKAVFADTCGGCHTLSKAGTSGSVGPNLDDVSLGASDIEGIIRDGRGGMPAQGDKLSDDEISAVAAFVAGN
jgi:mono/diheme cytochrome c family protein